MNISESKQGDATILGVEGRLDGNTCGDLEKKLFATIDEGSARIVLDFAGLAYVSSAGLRVVLMGAKRVKGKSGKLALCALSPNIQEVFSISGFDKILTIRKTREEALAAVA
ncbi:STAS domain-containing protein [Zavarzinia sp. CC-PAN008]|uniref:STAS domain-containing protein n=1 Tax=Zavarzinia sp. CC-PAN008 TaxID=3243332 RepID=UPI003F748F56